MVCIRVKFLHKTLIGRVYFRGRSMIDSPKSTLFASAASHSTCPSVSIRARLFCVGKGAAGMRRGTAASKCKWPYLGPMQGAIRRVTVPTGRLPVWPTVACKAAQPFRLFALHAARCASSPRPDHCLAEFLSPPRALLQPKCPNATSHDFWRHGSLP
jgi:hypothetical protein